MKKEIWKKICEIFIATKKLGIQLEEIQDDHKAFLQPVNEFKSALDHIIRVKAIESGLATKAESKQYTESNLNKALGHIYRAFFDTADFYSVVLREKIINLLSKYSSDTIHKVLPDYYSEKRIFIERVNKKLADIRAKKDIGNDSNILPSIDDYVSNLEKIELIYEEIISKIPQLDRLQKIENRKNIRKRIFNYIAIGFGVIGIIGTIFTILTFCIK